MHLSKLILENFQGHSYSEFNLNKGLNVLVGISNSGKTSIARALSLVIFNQWDKSWVRFSAKFCRVSIVTTTGVEVIREKGEKVNRYILRIPDQLEQVFDSFGTSVPEVIQHALQIHTISVDSTDSLNLNLAGQLDPLFLLSQTGSYRAKVLGKLSGATYLDYAIREINKEKRQITAEKASKELEFNELKIQIDKLSAVECYSAQIVEIEQRLSLLDANETRLERIRTLSTRIKLFKDTWTRETVLEAIIGRFEPLVLLTFAAKVDNITRLRSLCKRVRDLKIIYTKYFDQNALLEYFDFSIVHIFTEKILRIDQIKNLAVRFNKNIKEFTDKSNELKQVEQKYQETKEQYSVILKNNGVCPICNSNTKNLCVL